MAKSSTGKQKVTSKRIKKKFSRLHFPHIFRSIPAITLRPRTFWRMGVVIIILSILLLHLIQFVQGVYSTYYEAQIQQAEKQKIESEITKWQHIATLRPNYRDAYFELAVLTYQLGRTEETKKYLDKVFELDPNFQPARDLERALNK